MLWKNNIHMKVYGKIYEQYKTMGTVKTTC